MNGPAIVADYADGRFVISAMHIKIEGRGPKLGSHIRFGAMCLASWLALATSCTRPDTSGKPEAPVSQLVEAASNVTVRGIVTGARLPIAKVSLSFGTADISRVATIAVEEDGHFEARLPQPGPYFVDVHSIENLRSTRRFCDLHAGDNECNIDLPPTRIDLSIAMEGRPTRSKLVSVNVRGPVAPTEFEMAGFLTLEEASSFTLIGLDYGTHTIVAFTPDRLTSVAPLVLTLTPDRPTAAGRLKLAKRALWLSVIGSDGSPLPAATARTRLFALNGQGGRIDAERVPAGMQMVIQAPGFLPSCQLAAVSTEQHVTLLPRSANRTYVTLTPDPGRPIGIIEGVPGSACGLEVSAFRLDQATAAGPNELRFGIIGLPDGAYRYRASMLTDALQLTVPGKGIDRYHVPPGCLVCK